MSAEAQIGPAMPPGLQGPALPTVAIRTPLSRFTSGDQAAGPMPSPHMQLVLKGMKSAKQQPKGVAGGSLAKGSQPGSSAANTALAAFSNPVGKVSGNKFVRAARKIQHVTLLSRKIGRKTLGQVKSIEDHSFPTNSFAEFAHMIAIVNELGGKCMEWFHILRADMDWASEGQNDADILEIKHMCRQIQDRTLERAKVAAEEEHIEVKEEIQVVINIEERPKMGRKRCIQLWHVAMIATRTVIYFLERALAAKNMDKMLFETLTLIERYDSQCKKVDMMANAMANHDRVMANGEAFDPSNRHNLDTAVRIRKKRRDEILLPLKRAVENVNGRIMLLHEQARRVEESLKNLNALNAKFLPDDNEDHFLDLGPEENPSDDNDEDDQDTPLADVIVTMHKETPGGVKPDDPVELHTDEARELLEDDMSDDELNIMDDIEEVTYEDDPERYMSIGQDIMLRRARAKEELLDAFYAFRNIFNTRENATTLLSDDIIDMAMALHDLLEKDGKDYTKCQTLYDISGESLADREMKIAHIYTAAMINIKRKAACKDKLRQVLIKSNRVALDLLRKARRYLRAEREELNRAHEASVRLATEKAAEVEAANKVFEGEPEPERMLDAGPDTTIKTKTISGRQAQQIMLTGNSASLEGVSGILKLLETRYAEVKEQPKREAKAKKLLRRAKHAHKNVVRMKHELQAWHNRTDEIHDSVEVKKDEKKLWKWNTMYDTQLSDGEEDDADFENDNEESIEQRLNRLAARIAKQVRIEDDSREILHKELQQWVPEIRVVAFFEPVLDHVPRVSQDNDGEAREKELRLLEQAQLQAQLELSKIAERRQTLLAPSDGTATPRTVREQQVDEEVQAARELAKAQALVDQNVRNTDKFQDRCDVSELVGRTESGSSHVANFDGFSRQGQGHGRGEAKREKKTRRRKKKVNKGANPSTPR